MGIEDEGEHFEVLSNATAISYEKSNLLIILPILLFLLPFSYQKIPLIGFIYQKKLKSTKKYFWRFTCIWFILGNVSGW